jgi:hypothetical protein
MLNKFMHIVGLWVVIYAQHEMHGPYNIKINETSTLNTSDIKLFM